MGSYCVLLLDDCVLLLDADRTSCRADRHAVGLVARRRACVRESKVRGSRFA
jgi:hypothetical protein